jgi:hypothetical protein
MSEEQIKYMAERFLCWKLPEHFHPDNGIKFVPLDPWHTSHPNKTAHWPVGTNLFDYTQAVEMVCHMVEGLPDVS